MKPKIVPPIETPSATLANRCFFDRPIAAQTMPAGPKIIGRKNTASTPKTIPAIDKAFPLRSVFVPFDTPISGSGGEGCHLAAGIVAGTPGGAVAVDLFVPIEELDLPFGCTFSTVDAGG